MQKVQQVLERVGDLPAMPGVVSEILRLTDDPGVAMAEVCGAVERDPALTAKILRVSNSAYYGMRQHVGNLNLALVILGVREVRNIILGVSVIESVRSEKADSLLPADFWDHSSKTAGLARRLGTTLNLPCKGEAFVCGLLHDIGRVVMARFLPDEYAKAIASAPDMHGDALCAAEVKAFGFSHADAAAALTTRWNFPEALKDAMGLHHYHECSLLSEAKDPKLAAVIRLADGLARMSPADAAETLDDVGGLEAWACFGMGGSSPEAAARRTEVVRAIREQSLNAPSFV